MLGNLIGVKTQVRRLYDVKLYAQEVTATSYTIELDRRLNESDVTLSVSADSGVLATSSFTPVTLSSDEKYSTLDFTFEVALAPGTYPVTVTGTRGNGESTSITFNVTKA